MHQRGISDFFDALVAMKFLDREGDGATAHYFNTPLTALYLDRDSPRYIGGILEMLNGRLFEFWNDLPEALRTGKPQNETKGGGKGMFEELYADPARLEQFLGGDDRVVAHQFRGVRREVRFQPVSKRSAMWAARRVCSAWRWRSGIRTCAASHSTFPWWSRSPQRSIAAAGLADRVSTASGRFL